MPQNPGKFCTPAPSGTGFCRNFESGFGFRTPDNLRGQSTEMIEAVPITPPIGGGSLLKNLSKSDSFIV
jgi:hypothetical protein